MKVYWSRPGTYDQLYGGDAVEIVETETQTTSTGRTDVTNETVVAVCQTPLAPVVVAALNQREYVRAYQRLGKSWTETINKMREGDRPWI